MEKSNRKKVFAREYLYILTFLVISGILLGGWHIIRIRTVNKINQYGELFKKKESSFFKPYRLQLFYSFNDVDLSNIKDVEEAKLFLKLVKRDSVQSSLYKAKKLDDPEYSLSEKEFKERILYDNKSEEYLKELVKLKRRYTKNEESFFAHHSNSNVVGYAIVGLFFVLIPLRLLVYSIRWSIKQLKN